MIEFYKTNKKNIDKITHFCIFALILYIFIKYFASYFAPFIFGYILCVILYPIAKFLQVKFKFTKGLSSIIAIVILIFLFSVIGMNVISRFVEEANAFIENIPTYINNAVKIAKEWKELFERYFKIMPEELQLAINRIFETLISSTTSILGSGVKTGSINVFKSLPNIIMVVLLGFISSFFLIKDKESIEAFVLRQLPESFKMRLNIVKKGLFKAVGGYIRAQLILMSMICVICLIGLTIIGYPYALFLALIIGFVDALPVFGSGAIIWPWCIYSFSIKDYTQSIVLIIIYIIIILTRQMLEPRVLGNQIGLHPLVTLMSIYIGLKVFGVFGFIIGPIVVVTLKAMQDSDLLPRWK